MAVAVALKSAQITVGTTPVNLLSGFVNWGNMQDVLPLLVENAGSATVYIGGPSVTTANGFILTAGAAIPFTLLNSDTPWAVSGSSTLVCVLAGRQ
jgi:hypothetical protein